MCLLHPGRTFWKTRTKHKLLFYKLEVLSEWRNKRASFRKKKRADWILKTSKMYNLLIFLFWFDLKCTENFLMYLEKCSNRQLKPCSMVTN